MAIKGEVAEKDKAFPILERCTNNCIARLETVDFAEILTVKMDKRTDLEAKRDLEVVFESDVQYRKVFLDIMFATVGAACANSPGILAILAPFFVLAVLVFWVKKVKERFVEFFGRTWGLLYLQPA